MGRATCKRCGKPLPWNGGVLYREGEYHAACAERERASEQRELWRAERAGQRTIYDALGQGSVEGQEQGKAGSLFGEGGDE